MTDPGIAVEQPSSAPLGAFEVCGVRIEAATVPSATSRLLAAARDRRPARFHLCNADVLSRAARDTAYGHVLATSEANFADGTPVVWTAHRVGLPEASRVPGAELFVQTVREGVDDGIAHYLYGSTPEVLDQLREGLHSAAPGAQIVALDSPPFRELADDEFDQLCQRIRESGAHIVWVGLGTPRQDLLMQRLEDAGLPVVSVAVGAAFDFLGGAKQRAPDWMQRLGLEWLHRLLDEPGRLWRRYLIGNTTYLWKARRTAQLLDRNDALIRSMLDETRRQSRSRPRVTRTLVIADAAVIALASVLAYWGRINLDDSLGVFQNEIPVAIGVLPLWLTILYGFGCYRPQLQNQSSEAFRRFLGATSVAVLVLGFVSFLFQLDLSRLYVLLTFVAVLVLGTAVRGGIRLHLRRRRMQGQLTRRVLVVGTDSDALEVVHAMQRYPVAGYVVVGFVADGVPEGTTVVDDLEVLGPIDRIQALARQHDASLVLVSPTSVAPGTLQDVTIAIEDSDVDLAVAPSLFEVVTRRVTVESVANVPILHVDQIRLVGWKAALKRTLDLSVTLVLAVLSLPVIAVAAIAIKVSDRGPILFVQRRVGKDGRVFRLYKFRTMVPDAEERLGEVAALNEAGQHFFKVRRDPRVTRVGRFLRKWSIDEIPQFWNVIRGDMSLVGPRPPIPAEVVHYEPWHRRRLRIKPGITGVWQVSGRADVPFDEAVRLDLFYIENWSLGYDAYILAKTVRAVLGRGGAY